MSENEDIEKKISARLRGRERGKDYKDTDIVNYTKKYSAAYDIVTTADLSKIETDNVTAYKLVEKTKIWPVYNTGELKDTGNTSGGAYLKVKVREYLGARPLDSKDARETYVRSIEKLRMLLEPAKNVYQVTEILKSFVNLDSFEFGTIPDNIPKVHYISTTNTGNLKEYSSRGLQKYFDDVFGKRFYTFCKAGTDSSKKVHLEATLYEGFSPEMESAAAEKKKETALIYVDKNQKIINAIKGLPDDKTVIMNAVRELDRYSNLQSYAKADAISFYERQVALWQKNVDNPAESLPKYLRARPDDWSWTGTKKKEEKVAVDELDKVAKSTETIFQKYGIEDWKKSAARTPLAYIKRTGGLAVEDIDVSRVTEDFGYRNVVFGNYVNNQERKENLRHFLGAMLDMHEVINVDVKEINKLGGLDINFGSTGCGTFSKAMACYFPSLKAINLTKKKGDGSLAHEWSHYLDNILGEGGTRRAVNSLSGTDYKDYLNGSEKIKTLFLEYKNWLMNGGGERTVLVTYAPQRKYKYRIQGSTTDEAIKSVQTRYPNYSKYENSESQDLLKYYGYLAYQLNDKKPLQVPLKTKSSYYYYISSCWSFDYYAQHDELFARAFAWFIEDALKQKGRVSNYLVDNKAGMGLMALIVPVSQWPFPYKEEDKSFLRDWFDRLFSAIRTEYNIKPFHWNTQERADEYSEYAPDKTAKIETGVIVEEDGDTKAEGDIEHYAKGYSFRRFIEHEKTSYQLIFGNSPENVFISKLTKSGWEVFSKADDGTINKITQEPFKTYKLAIDYVVDNDINGQSKQTTQMENKADWTNPDTTDEPLTNFGFGETMLTEGLNIGDEGSWLGGERRVKGFDDIGNVIIIDLDEAGNEVGEERKVSKEAFEKEFAKFPVPKTPEDPAANIIEPAPPKEEPPVAPTDIIPEKTFTNIKDCLLADGDNENDYIIEGTKIHHISADKKITYEAVEFDKSGIFLKYIPESVLDDPRSNKYVTYMDLTEMFIGGKISIDNIQSVQSVTHCIKAIKGCLEKIDIEKYAQETQKHLQEVKTQLEDIKLAAKQKEEAEVTIKENFGRTLRENAQELSLMSFDDFKKWIRDSQNDYYLTVIEPVGSETNQENVIKTEYDLVKHYAEKSKESNSDPSTEDYQTSLEGAETALEFTEDPKEKQDLQDYIEGLKIAIEAVSL